MLLAVTLLFSATPGLPLLQAVLEPSEEFCVECCSLYCAAAPTVGVSRHLPPQAGNEYGPGALDDGKGETAWVVRHGVGDWFEFVFEVAGFHADFPVDNTRTGVDSLYLWNGYNKSPQRWREHSRVRKLRMTVDGRELALVTLLDDARPQRVVLPPTLLRRGMKLRFTIVETYPGTHFDETALSEVRLDGYGHH